MTLLSIIVLPYMTWLFYLSVMALMRARDAGTLSPFASALGYPLLVVGYVLDFATNVVICTPILLELPQETTVTARLSRHKKAGGWRGVVATWVGNHLLDPFDPDGRHL